MIITNLLGRRVIAEFIVEGFHNRTEKAEAEIIAVTYITQGAFTGGGLKIYAARLDTGKVEHFNISEFKLQ